jgi:hypothetical protein
LWPGIDSLKLGHWHGTTVASNECPKEAVHCVLQEIAAVAAKAELASFRDSYMPVVKLRN